VGGRRDPPPHPPRTPLTPFPLLSQPTAKCTIPAAHKSAVLCLDWLDESARVLASGGSDGRVSVLDVANASVLNTLTLTRGGGSAAAGASSLLLGGGAGGGGAGLGFSAAPLQSEITCVRFAPNGRWVAAGDGLGRVMVFDLNTGRTLACWENGGTWGVGGSVGGTVSGHRGSVLSLDFHPHELILASGGADHTVRFWSVDPSTRWRPLASSPADTGAVKAVRFVGARGAGGSGEEAEEAGGGEGGEGGGAAAPCIALAAITDAHLRVWTVPGVWDPEVTDATHTLDVVDVKAWAGVAAAWMGSNVRERGGGPGGDDHPSSLTRTGVAPRLHLHLVVASADGSFMRAHGLDLSNVAPLNGVTEPLSSSSYAGGTGRGPAAASSSSSAPAVHTPKTRTAGSILSRGSAAATESKDGEDRRSPRGVSPRVDAGGRTPASATTVAASRAAPASQSSTSTRGTAQSASHTPRVARISLEGPGSDGDEDDEDDDDNDGGKRADDEDEDLGVGGEKAEEKEEEDDDEEGFEIDASHFRRDTGPLRRSGSGGLPPREGMDDGDASFDVPPPAPAPVPAPAAAAPAPAPARRVPNMDGVSAALAQVVAVKNMVVGLQQQPPQRGLPVPAPVPVPVPAPVDLGSRGSSPGDSSLQGDSEFRPLTSASARPTTAVVADAFAQLRAREAAAAVTAAAQGGRSPRAADLPVLPPSPRAEVGGASGAVDLGASIGIGLDEIAAAMESEGGGWVDDDEAAATAAVASPPPAGISSTSTSAAGAAAKPRSSTRVARPPLASPGGLDVSSLAGLDTAAGLRKERAIGDFVPSRRHRPAGLPLEAFLPDNAAAGFGASRVLPLAASTVFVKDGALASAEDRVVRAVSSHRDAFLRTLKKRRRDVGVAAAQWREGDVRGALDGAAAAEAEPGALTDVLAAVVGLAFDTKDPPPPPGKLWSAAAAAAAAGGKGGVGGEGGPPRGADVFRPTAAASLLVAPCAASGAGTGSFESLSLNLEGGTAILQAALQTLSDGLADET
jgi:WD40 repeat protein